MYKKIIIIIKNWLWNISSGGSHNYFVCYNRIVEVTGFQKVGKVINRCSKINRQKPQFLFNYLIFLSHFTFAYSISGQSASSPFCIFSNCFKCRVFLIFTISILYENVLHVWTWIPNCSMWSIFFFFFSKLNLHWKAWKFFFKNENL